ncbi:LysR family transcriptional regulator [Nonomuraea jiangxiensis]|uniref:DNA-binding transcriptional regulator, LysR family n=1 Tax=Nonomuraea jiangxiensis TaxID=633440 RepID=A0A1G8ZE57_9ACTN|nr:LysR family transcriptional regulator [Nonomuraea jiangxiensis]SDK13308.1 DNA-binding transcriptional regulator, LysR family [Nonomuraea jiangxiensis]
MPMTLEEIEAFVCIAELGGFTEASRRLNRSQPAISRRIRELEQSLGAALFERTGRRVALTDAGRTLLPFAEAALATVRDGERAVREQVRQPGSPLTLSLAIVGTLADSHLVDVLRTFEARFPQASVELRTATSREVSGLVRSGEASLGLRYFPDADPQLECVPLGTEKLLVVVPASHEVTEPRLPDLRALENERWIGFPPERGQPDSFGHLLERRLPAGRTGPPITRVDSLTAQKRLVQAGLGIALMPVSSVREELRIGSLRAIEVENLHADLPVVVVRRRRGYQGRLATAFLELLAEHTPELRG